MTDTDLRRTWTRIEAWLQANMPWAYERLAPGANDERLDAAEATVGFALPPDFRESYRIHDGMQSYGPWLRGPSGHWGVRPSGFLYDAHDFHDLEMAVRFWNYEKGTNLPGDNKTLCEVRGPIRPEGWCRTLLSVARGPNFCYYLDMDPAPGGQVGQVIRYVYDSVAATYVAPSYGSWLEALATLLEADIYVYCPPMERMESALRAADELRYDRDTPEREAEYQRLEAIIGRVGSDD